MTSAIPETPGKTWDDYRAAFGRRRASLIGVFVAIFLVGLLAALLWPPTYRSTATILIEEQEIPPDLVRSTITSYAAQRIQVISQRVMTRANLTAIIEKYGLYEEAQRSDTTDEIIDAMRDDILLETISADVIDPRTGRPAPATIAFQLGFDYPQGPTAARVANELTNLFLNENIKSRTSRASETVGFLRDEAERLQAELQAASARLADFKEANVNRLPELKGLTTQLFEQANRDLDDIATQIRTQEERKIYLQGQLAQIEPYGDDVNLSPVARLKALRTQYLALLGRYSPEHPDVQRVRREMAGLEQETGLDAGDLDARLEQLAGMRTRLAGLRERYADDHPDIVNLKRSIASIEQLVEEAGARAASEANGRPRRTPDNPAYITLESQLQSAEASLQSLRSRRAQIQAKRSDYERRLAAMPQIERQYNELLREQENAAAKYQEIRAKQMEAQVGAQLEQEAKGERFSVVEPPQIPEEPISPNRPAIVILGLILALFGSFGITALREAMDSSLRGSRSVAAALGVAPLTTIPFIENRRERGERRRRQWLGLGLLVLVVVAMLGLVHLFWAPLDVLWFRALRVLGDRLPIDA